MSLTFFDAIDYADPLLGVGSATSAGPTLPNGSIHPSPETLTLDCGGYLRNSPIVGFGQAYTSGSGGIKNYGNFLLAPTVDSVEPNRKKRASFAVNGSEVARCYEYKVTLENGISMSVTPAHSAALYTFSYPQDKDAFLLVDVAHKMDNDAAMRKGTVTVDPLSKRIYGGGRFFGNFNRYDWDMFFAMEFDADATELGVMEGEELRVLPSDHPTTVNINEEKRLGAYIKFTKNTQKSVKVKIAISFVSAEQAAKFLSEEIPNYDSEAIKENAKKKWRKVFNAIDFYSDDRVLLRKVYTAMYHMNIQPRNRTGDHGTWDDFHTIWDTWKTTFPFYSLVYPQKMGSIIDSMIDRAKKNQNEGRDVVLCDSYLSGLEYPAGQGGNDVENVIVDAYLKGVPLGKYTWDDAYEVLLQSAASMRSPEYIEKGYVTSNNQTVKGAQYSWRMRAGSATLGFALNDKAIANMSRKMGKQEEYESFEKRSQNWLNVWNKNAESEGFFGFPQIRNDDGEFEADFDPHGGYNSHFYEATSWDASYINYNDVPLLIETMGGVETFIKRLMWACEHSVNYYNDDLGKEGYLNFTNEPSFHIPWLFCTDQIKRPDLAAKVIDSVIARFSLENDYPGDEDNGGMSSYYLFLMCGFFPYATTENYYLHGTRLEKILLRLGNGNELCITGENVGEKNIYVQSATWQGKPLNECKLTHSQIMEGGELHFVMGAEPSMWARK